MTCQYCSWERCTDGCLATLHLPERRPHTAAGRFQLEPKNPLRPLHHHYAPSQNWGTLVGAATCEYTWLNYRTFGTCTTEDLCRDAAWLLFKNGLDKKDRPIPSAVLSRYWYSSASIVVFLMYFML